MTQRNYMNQRYRDEERTGKTRKSAASAKPATQAGASVRGVVTKDPKARRKQERAKERERQERANSVPVEYTPKERFWRRIWWATLVGALVCLVISWMAMRISAEYVVQITYGSMIAAYAFLAAMIFIDIKFVRPARKRAQEKGMRGLTKKERRELELRKQAEAAYKAEHPSVFTRMKNAITGSGKKNKAKADEVDKDIAKARDLLENAQPEAEDDK